MSVSSTEPPATVPTLNFDSAAFPPGQAMALWAATVAYDARLPGGKGPEGFRAKMQAWRVETMLVTAGFMCEIRLVRTPARVQIDARDSLCLMLVLDDWWRGDFDGIEVQIPRGRIGVIDFSRPFDTLSPDSRFVMISVPRPTLELGEERAADRHGLVLEGTSGRLLAEHFEALARWLPETPVADLPVVATATLAMIRSCLAGAPRRAKSTSTLSLHQRVRAFVNAHLTDADLTPVRIAEALSVTRSTLYRAFSTAGVAGFIQAQRLDAIHALLENAGESRSLVELALTFGFASHAHLTTAFRRRFGYPPSQARSRSPAAADPAATGLEAFQEWLRGLDASAHAQPGSPGPDTP